MEDTKTIRIKYFTDKIDRLTYVGGKSDWIDLRCAEEIQMKAGEFRLIPLGVAMQLPKGYEAHVVPRSSTYKNFGIIQTNHTGIIMKATAATMTSGLWRPMLLGIRRFM